MLSRYPNGLTFGVVAAALLLGWGASACTFDHMFNFFNCLACVRVFVRFALVCQHFSVIHSVVIVHGAGDICLLFKTDSAQSSSNKCKNYLLKIYSRHINFLNTI